MTAKERAKFAIDQLPEDTSYDDIAYHIYVLQCIEDGEKDYENGKTLTHEEVEKKLAKWLM